VKHGFGDDYNVRRAAISRAYRSVRAATPWTQKTLHTGILPLSARLVNANAKKVKVPTAIDEKPRQSKRTYRKDKSFL
jgi:hypothetical protein